MWVAKDVIRPKKVRLNKSSIERMVANFFMKFSLVKSIPLESAHQLAPTDMSTAFSLRSVILFLKDQKRQDSTSRFCMTTMRAFVKLE